MFHFTKTDIKVKRLIVFIILFISILIFMYLYSRPILKEENENIQNKSFNTIIQQNIIFEEKPEERNIWQIEIQKISLKATISEGTNQETLKKFIGHFEETQKEKGNIGLAAHNRGYEVNYFKDLKYLREGDEIKYQHNQYKNTYEVKKNIIITDTNWEYLKNTEENTLTLITCVENEPNYRRCIQAIEKQEREEID